MNAIFDPWVQIVWRVTWQSALLVLVVALVAVMLRKRITPRWQYLLWFVVLVRLLVVVTPPSPWSAFNLLAEQRSDPPKENRTVASSIPPSSQCGGILQGSSVQRDSLESPAVTLANNLFFEQGTEASIAPHEKLSVVEQQGASESARSPSKESTLRMSLGPVIAIF